MGFGLDLTETEPEKVGKGGEILPVGMYHTQIVEIDEWAKDGNTFVVKHECLAGPHQGKTISDYMSKSAKAQPRIVQLGVVTGLFTMQDVNGWKAQGYSPDIPWRNIIGRQCVIEVEEREHNNKTSLRVGFWVLSVDDERAANVPKNDVMLRRFKAMIGQGDGGGQAPAPAPQQSGQPQTSGPANGAAGGNGSNDDLFS